MKIFFIAPQATHYRETFYKKVIDAYPQHEWLVIDGEKSVDDGRPTYYKEFAFPHKRFREVVRRVGPFMLRDYEGLLEFIAQEAPDIIICQAIPGTRPYRGIARLARQGKVKLIMWSCLWEHNSVKKHPLRALKQAITRKYLNAAHYHIAYSTYAQNRLLGFGYPKEQIYIAYNGIELDDMQPATEGRKAALKQDLGIADVKHRFLYVGGLGEDKNVILLLQAVKQLSAQYTASDIKTIIVGSGPQMDLLKAYTRDNNLEDYILFTGRIVDGVDDYFQVADCIVLPGAGGLALNQALYWEKPCIASHGDGTEEDLVIEGETGFRFRENDAASLAGAMNRFCDTPRATIEAFGKNGHRFITEKSNVNKMVETFREVIDLLSTQHAKEHYQ